MLLFLLFFYLYKKGWELYREHEAQISANDSRVTRQGNPPESQREVLAKKEVQNVYQMTLRACHQNLSPHPFGFAIYNGIAIYNMRKTLQ